MPPLRSFAGIFAACTVSLFLLAIAFSLNTPAAAGIWLISSLLAIGVGLFYDLHHLNKDN